MTQTTEVEAPVRMTLTEAQETAARALAEADKLAAQYRRRVLDLEGDVSAMRTVLAHKETELERLRSEVEVSVALVREHFSLYRDLMRMDDPA